LLDISQADVSKLMTLRLHGFSLDRLIAILTRLERDVEICVTKSPASRRLGKVKTVLAAQRTGLITLPEQEQALLADQV
jgi:Helix-turn-helix domain